VIPRCGHWIGEERPDFIAEQLLAFFAEDGDGASRDESLESASAR
jgi:hypothetical protein